MDGSSDAGDLRVRATVADKALRRNAQVWVAYADSGLVSDVQELARAMKAQAEEVRALRERLDRVKTLLS